MRWAASANLSKALIATKGEAPLTELFVFLAAALRIWATVLKSEDEVEGLLCVSLEAERVSPEIVAAPGIWNATLWSRYDRIDVGLLCATGENEEVTGPYRSEGAAPLSIPENPLNPVEVDAEADSRGRVGNSVVLHADRTRRGGSGSC